MSFVPSNKLAQLSVLSLLLPSVILASPTARYAVKRDVNPNFPYDPATTKACTYWYDNLDSTTTCQSAASDNGITMEQLLRWNPYLKLNSAGVCTGWAHPVSYCVEAYLEGVTTTSASATTTAAPSSTTSTTPRPSAASWTDMGCYVDSDDRTLQNRVDIEGGGYEMTIEKCQNECWAQNYKYAGIEVGQECYCDNSIRNERAKDAETTCTSRCYGNEAQLCGGDWRLQIFQGRATASPTDSDPDVPATTTAVSAPTGPVTWALKGCYIDVTPPDVKRTLYKAVQVPGGENAMTIAACQTACWKEGFPYAGVEFGKECYCGASLRNPLATDQATCNKPCAGNATQICGGPNSISVYEGRIGGSVLKDTWAHLGCYKDLINARALDNLTSVPGGINGLTVNACKAAAKARLVRYAGVENRGECWTGNTIKGETVALSDCDRPCYGNATEMCGGLSRMNIYENTVPTTKWLSIGCYTTSSTALTLGFLASAAVEDNKLTASSCQAVCLSRGFTYSGLTGGNACYCDKNLNSAGVPAPEGSSGCNIKCPGASSDTCGGKDRMSVFMQASL